MEEQQQSNRLEFFPITFFATVMGLAGLTIAWEKAQTVFSMQLGIYWPLILLTTFVFFVLTAIYSMKFMKFRAAVMAEIKHPVKLNFFPALSISLLLLSVVYLHISAGLSLVFWAVGSALHLVIVLYILNAWMHHKHFKINHMNPAWFIPAVGNVLVPVAGVPLGFIEVSWFFFSIGLMFWIILFSIMFNRILFHEPIDQGLLPTLFILIAPPAVGFISYVRLVGEVDSFARVLYYAALFITILLITQFSRFSRLPFFLSWWAYSFPLAAISIASMLMYEQTGVDVFRWTGLVLLLSLTALVVLIVFKTAKAIKNKKVCVPGQ